MIKNILRGVFLISLLSTTTIGFSQKSMKKKEAKNREFSGNQQIVNKDYADAYENFHLLAEAFPKKEVYRYKEAICKTHIEGLKEEGIATLRTLLPRENDQDFSDVNYHLADGLFYNNQYEEAKVYFEKYYDQIKKSNDREWIRQIQLKIDHNHNASIYSKDSVENVEIINISSPINTSGWEYSPFVTPQEDMMVFTYMGEQSKGGKLDERFKSDENGTYSEDIMISYKDENDKWGTPSPITDVNTIQNEACVGISPSGERLFIFQSGNGNLGDLYETYIDGAGNWSKITPLKGDVNSKEWEGSATITQDGKTLYFASTRFGGYGGRDIYSATLQSNGKWGNIKNLGPQINSEYDEDSPFIHPDKKTLYFSTNGTRSMGGYDIVYAVKGGGDRWNFKDNLGVPINTVGDDRFYILSADGKTGYFSRESDNGTKDQDIFIIRPGVTNDAPILTVISGKVYLDDVVTDAVLDATIIENDELQGIYHTSQHSKKYTMLLNPESNYRIEVKINGEVMRVDTLNSDFVNDFIELEHDFYIYTEAFAGIKELESSLQREVQKEYNKNSAPPAHVNPDHKIVTNDNDTITFHQMSSVIKKNRIAFYRANPDIAAKDGITPEFLDLAEKTALTDNVDYDKENGYEPVEHNSSSDVLANNTDVVSEKDKEQLTEVFHPTFGANELVYRVQVAAYRKPENYNWGGNTSYGDVLEVTYDDGITRFTIGGTIHLTEALELQKKLIEYGVNDAFIVAFKGQERIPLYELISK